MVIFAYEEVAWLKGYDGVELISFAYEFPAVFEVAYYIVLNLPRVQCIPLDALGREPGNQVFVVIKLIEVESRAQF